MTNTYLTNSKVNLIKQARQDFYDVYGENCRPFTNKIFFYFVVKAGRKFVHKSSLEFVYNNAETWTKDPCPDQCQLTKQYEPMDVCAFLSSYRGELLPELLEDNDKFLVYEFYEGDPVTHINSDEFFSLRDLHDDMMVTAFYNSMAYNLVRSEHGIKLVDLKHFEVKDHKPFFVYLYNMEIALNVLYVERGTDCSIITQHLGIDYPMAQTTIIEY